MNDPARRRIPLTPGPDFSPYGLINTIVVPRPIAWISTRAADRSENLAPFSYFQAVSAEPPIVMVSIGSTKPSGEGKDTLRNILESRGFVINLVPEALATTMVASSAHLPHGESEIAKLGLETFPAELVDAPCLTVSPVNVECRLHSTVGIGESVVVFGELLLAHVKDELLNDRGLIDAALLKPIARLGEYFYEPFREQISIRRPR